MATSGDRTAALSEAKAALGRKDYHRAIEKATDALSTSPKEAPAYLIRAEALRRLGKPERCLADLAVAIRLQPDRPSAYVVRAEILKKRCQFDQAIADATQAIFLDPDNAAAYSIRATCREAIGDLEGASADHEELVRIDPTRPSSPQTGRASAPSHAPADHPHPAIPEDDRHVFADGQKPDRSYRSRPAIGDDEAAEVLGEASGYKPGYLPKAQDEESLKQGLSHEGLGLRRPPDWGGARGRVSCYDEEGSKSAPARETPSSQVPATIPSASADVGRGVPKVATSDLVKAPEPEGIAASTGAPKVANEPAPPQAATSIPSGERKPQSIQVRQVRITLDEIGDCRLLVDTREHATDPIRPTASRARSPASRVPRSA